VYAGCVQQPKFVRLSVYLPRWLYDWIGHEATRNGVPASTYVRQVFVLRHQARADKEERGT